MKGGHWKKVSYQLQQNKPKNYDRAAVVAFAYSYQDLQFAWQR